mmetsp:Transcript_582/g.1586  ORF Transcript_582/g.1586 Transcript_582/m.1586 type:complete len:290 (+) Transcript_582:938-1807(+)
MKAAFSHCRARSSSRRARSASCRAFSSRAAWRSPSGRACQTSGSRPSGQSSASAASPSSEGSAAAPPAAAPPAPCPRSGTVARCRRWQRAWTSGSSLAFAAAGVAAGLSAACPHAGTVAARSSPRTSGRWRWRSSHSPVVAERWRCPGPGGACALPVRLHLGEELRHVRGCGRGRATPPRSSRAPSSGGLLGRLGGPLLPPAWCHAERNAAFHSSCTGVGLGPSKGFLLPARSAPALTQSSQYSCKVAFPPRLARYASIGGRCSSPTCSRMREQASRTSPSSSELMSGS